MQVPPPHALENPATGMTVGLLLSVVLAGLVQSTWNCQRLRLLDP